MWKSLSDTLFSSFLYICFYIIVENLWECDADFSWDDDGSLSTKVLPNILPFSQPDTGTFSPALQKILISTLLGLLSTLTSTISGLPIFWQSHAEYEQHHHIFMYKEQQKQDNYITVAIQPSKSVNQCLTQPLAGCEIFCVCNNALFIIIIRVCTLGGTSQ